MFILLYIDKPMDMFSHYCFVTRCNVQSNPFTYAITCAVTARLVVRVANPRKGRFNLLYMCPTCRTNADVSNLKMENQAASAWWAASAGSDELSDGPALELLLAPALELLLAPELVSCTSDTDDNGRAATSMVCLEKFMTIGPRSSGTPNGGAGSRCCQTNAMWLL